MTDTLIEEFTVQGGAYALGDRDESWDGGAAEKSYDLPEDASCWMWRDPDGDPASKSSYKLPFVSKSGGKHAVWKAITAIAGRLSQTDIPDADKAGVKKKLEGYYAKARSKYGDDSIQPPWSSSTASDPGEFLSAVVPLTHVDVRDPSANPDNTWTMSGYAAVFNTQAIYLDSKWFQVIVELAPTAFDGVLRTQNLGQADGVVHFNIGHDMNRAVAATNVPAGQPGSLQLAADAHGLRYLAKVSKDDPDGVALAVKMRDGVIQQASMAFQVGEQKITETESDDGPDVILRYITQIGALFDVCACPQGVFSQTVSELQKFAAPFIGQPGAVALGGQPRHPADGGGAITVSEPEGSGRVVKPRLTAGEYARIRAHRRR